MSHILQSILERGQGARIVQIDYSEAFDTVNHQGILYKLCLVGIGGSACFVYIDTISFKPITARYGGWLSYTAAGITITAAEQCFGPVIVPPVHAGAFFHSGK